MEDPEIDPENNQPHILERPHNRLPATHELDRSKQKKSLYACIDGKKSKRRGALSSQGGQIIIVEIPQPGRHSVGTDRQANIPKINVRDDYRAKRLIGMKRCQLFHSLHRLPRLMIHSACVDC
jgi:hypothetical protein